MMPSVFDCEFARLPDGRWRCHLCERETRGSYENAPHRNCLFKITAAVSGPGSLFAAALANFGLTPDRVSRWLGKPCRCSRRIQALNIWYWKRLNELGRKLGW